MGTPGHQISNEVPHPVHLRPFFLSKYELTQAQWERVYGSNPSMYYPGRYAEPPYEGTLTWPNPVESVTWAEAVDCARRLDLALPFEAQVEYATRAGSTAAYHWGEDLSSLRDNENVADQSLARLNPSVAPHCAPWDDGFPYHAPVGSFAPNGYGLYDLHGNVMEWCGDEGYHKEHATGVDGPSDGENVNAEGDTRVTRGGNAFFHASISRSAYRFYRSGKMAEYSIGLRLARPVRTEP